MATIYKFPSQIKTILKTIREGFIDDEVREHLKKRIEYFQKNYPNSWDMRFSKDMLAYYDELSDKQKNNLERILQDPITKQEHPNGLTLT